MKSKIEFRKARKEDVEKAIPLLISSGEEALNYIFRDKVTEFLTYAFKNENGEFSFNNHYVLEVDQEVVGLGSRFTSKQTLGFMLSDFLNIVRFFGFKAIPVLLAGLKTEQIIVPPKKSEITLGHIAVSPNNQGKGLGKQIMENLINLPKNDNEFYVLDVKEGNDRAKSLYERLGFKTVKLVASTLKNKYSFVPSHYRMKL